MAFLTSPPSLSTIKRSCAQLAINLRSRPNSSYRDLMTVVPYLLRPNYHWNKLISMSRVEVDELFDFSGVP